MLGQNEGTFWLPARASTASETADALFYFIFYLALFFFVLIVVLMVVFVIKYLRREGRRPEKSASHNLTLEVTWTAIPLILVIIIFYIGFTGFVKLRTPPENALKINVYGQKWSWEFEYPNGHLDSVLHVPVNQDVALALQSLDVIHSLYIPEFRVKMDAVPGRTNKMWFRATRTGEFTIFCAEYCGTGHSDMLTTCVVHDEGGFKEWLANADPLKRLTPQQYESYLADPAAFLAANPEFEGLESPTEMGRRLYAKKGCGQCHSADGAASTGPTFKGIFGELQKLADGTDVTVDENYIRESILEPQAKVVAGYEPVMPTYKGRLSDRDINALIAYVESLKGD